MRERENKAYNLLRFGLIVGIVFGIPGVNWEASGRVLNALSGKEVDCSSGEANNKLYPYDLIAVPGAGTDVDEYGNVVLSPYERGRLGAAAQLFNQGYAPVVILLDGVDAQTNNAGVSYLRGQVKEVSNGKRDLLNSAVFMDEVSSNTATNIQVLASFMHQKGYKKVILATDGFHANRVEILACDYGLNAKTVSVEGLSPKTSASLLSPDPFRNWVVYTKEGLEVFTLAWDPGGYSTIAAKWLSKTTLPGNAEQ